MTLAFYNTLTRSKQVFTPIDAKNIRIYVCGPTVYDRIHVGNARPLVVFDVLVRLLRHHFPKVTYVRNITDVDDKIYARAGEEGITIQNLTDRTIADFHSDCLALNVADPDVEPRATQHINEMIAMIETLIDKGHAYVVQGTVFFSVASVANYGALSRRTQDELIAGARVEVAEAKRDPADFVLWKPSTGEDGWNSPWGRGRPGWHIECSAMSKAYLGEQFDIHGGGLDLIFPHHENEIAQSCAAHNTDSMARFWMHNGFVTVGGEKMAKSSGNFTTVGEVLAHHRGEAVRLALLSAQYRAPLDFSIEAVREAKSALDGLYRAVGDSDGGEIDAAVLASLGDDLNTPKALAELHELARAANKGDRGAASRLKASANLLGLLGQNADAWFQGGGVGDTGDTGVSEADILSAIEARNLARKHKDFATADRIRDELAEQGIILEDTPEGTIWRRG